MWKKVGYQPVGGLREIGFIENSDFLMVLGGRGRTIFNCLTTEKIARDRKDYYSENWDSETGVVEGIENFKGVSIVCGGFEYPDVIPKQTQDNWRILVKDEKRQDYKKDLEQAEVMYLVNKVTKEEIEVEVYHYKIVRGYGFSKTGKSFITAHAHGINFWVRNE